MNARCAFLAAALLGAGVAAGAPKYVIKLATVAPAGTTWVNELEAANRKLESGSAGEVGLRIYAGGVLGDEMDVVRKIRVGQVQAAAFTGMGLGELLPEVRIFEVPFLVGNDAEVDRLTAELSGRFETRLRSKKFVLLGFVPVGFVYIFSESPIRSLDELRKSKIWVWEGDPLAQGFFKAGGVSGIPLALPDVLTSLQTGLIRAVYGTPLGVIALQWHTKVKWRTDLPITHVMGALIVAEKAFTALPEKWQALLRAESRELCRRLTEEGRKENAEALEALAAQGVNTAAVDAKGRSVFRALGPKVGDAEAGNLYPRELLEKARAIVRAKPGTPAQ